MLVLSQSLTMTEGDARIAAARAAVAQFDERFPDWEELCSQEQSIAPRKTHAAIERLISKHFTKRAKPIRAHIRALKLKFKTRQQRRDYIFKKIGFHEEEVFDINGLPPADLAELPYLSSLPEDYFLNYADPAPNENRSGSCVKRALRIGVSYEALIAASDLANRTTKGTRRYQAAQRHLAAIKNDLRIVEDADNPAPFTPPSDREPLGASFRKRW